MFVAEIADDSMWLASTPWGSSSSNLRDMVHERLLQTKTHEGSSSKTRNYSYTGVPYGTKFSWSAIIMIEDTSAKSAKIVLLENLALYGIL